MVLHCFGGRFTPHFIAVLGGVGLNKSHLVAGEGVFYGDAALASPHVQVFQNEHSTDTGIAAYLEKLPIRRRKVGVGIAPHPNSAANSRHRRSKASCVGCVVCAIATMFYFPIF